jgi:nicotinamide riboside transporter PnuC
MIAQLLMNAALIEQWIVWFGIDITQSIVFFKLMIANGGGYYISMAVMYCVWLINAAFGLASWISDKRKQ